MVRSPSHVAVSEDEREKKPGRSHTGPHAHIRARTVSTVRRRLTLALQSSTFIPLRRRVSIQYDGAYGIIGKMRYRYRYVVGIIAAAAMVLVSVRMGSSDRHRHANANANAPIIDAGKSKFPDNYTRALNYHRRCSGGADFLSRTKTDAISDDNYRRCRRGRDSGARRGVGAAGRGLRVVLRFRGVAAAEPNRRRPNQAEEGRVEQLKKTQS